MVKDTKTKQQCLPWRTLQRILYTIPNGHDPEWTQSRMDTIPNGHNPKWTTIPNGPPSRMDTIPNEHNPEWTTIPNGHHPE